MELREVLDTIKPVSEAALEKLRQVIHIRSVKRGECVITQGQPSQIFLFIKEGVFRLWFKTNGKERTVGFGTPGNSYTSVSTMLNNRASLMSFEAVTDAEIYYLSHSELHELIENDKEIHEWLDTFLMVQIEVLFLKDVIFGTQTATDRLKAFALNRPEVYGSVPAKYMAQYLNIAPETLSRIQASTFRKKD